MIQGVHHASITTGDIKRLKDFYCGCLGFSSILEAEIENNPMADAIYGLSNAAAKMSMLRLNDFCLELFEFGHPVGRRGDPARPVCDQGYTHICLTVSDIAFEYERLRDLGMQFHCPPQYLPGLCAATYGRDPDGNIVELMEPEKNSPFDLSAQQR